MSWSKAPRKWQASVPLLGRIPGQLGVGGRDEPPPMQNAITKLELGVRLMKVEGDIKRLCLR